MPAWIVGAALCAAWAPACLAQGPDDDHAATSLMRYFTDSNRVGVLSLMEDYLVPLRGNGSLSLHWNNEHVTVPAIRAPAGSQEAVDAITTASRPISGNAFKDFVKVRNELQGELSKGAGAVDYYYSQESDYLAQQLGARFDRDFMNQQLNVSLGTSYGWDAISPLADDDTQTPPGSKTTLHWNAVATQIVSPSSMVRLGLEYNVVEGLQHNPYRNVYAGGSVVPERHPDHRVRRDAFVKWSQYLPNRSSVKLNYRLYSDDWGIASHEIDSRLSQYVTHAVYAEYEYRFYTQTRADFYRDEYTSIDGIGGYRSGDYRMAALSSHLFGFSLHCDLESLAADHPMLGRMGVRMSYERYFNDNNYSANFLETGLDVRF
jgi:hypothetical protein